MGLFDKQKKKGSGLFPSADKSFDIGRTQRQIENAQLRLQSVGMGTDPEKRNVVERALNLPQGQNALLDILEVLDRPGSAIRTAIDKGDEMGVGQSLLQGITGRTETTGADLAEKLGIQNKFGKAVAGFGLGLATDPTVLFGGAIAKGIGAGVKGASKLGSQAVKYSPKTQELLHRTRSVFDEDYSRFGRKPEEYIQRRRDFRNELKFEQQKSIKDVADIGKQFKIKPDEAKQLTNALESELKGKAFDLTKIPQRLQGAYQGLRNIQQRNLQRLRDAGIEIDEVEGYLPHVLTKKGKEQLRKNILGDTGAFGIKPDISVVKSRKLEGTVEDINLRKDMDFFEPDALKAQALGSYRQTGLIATKKFQDDVLSEFGQPIPKGEKINIPEGFVEYKPKDFSIYPITDEAGAVRAGISKNVPSYIVRKDIADDLDNFYKTFATDDSAKDLLKMWDGMQNTWKKFVTFSVPFHIRNVIGNVFNNYLGGVTNPKYYEQAMKIVRSSKDKIKVGDKAYTGEELYDLFQRQGLKAIGQFEGDIRTSQSINDAVEKILSWDAKTLPKQALHGLKPNQWFELSRRIGGLSDDWTRITHFIAKLDKGATPEEAAQSVRKFLFDYGQLSNAERNIFRRVFPFYTWTRKNIPLQLERLFLDPQKYTQINQARINFMDALGVSEEDMPEWLSEQFAIPVGQTEEENILANIQLPAGDINRALGSPTEGIKEMVSLLSPGLKLPVELAGNVSTFTGRPIQRFEGQTENFAGKDIDSRLAYILNQLGGRNISLLGQQLFAPEQLEGSSRVPLTGGLLRKVNPEQQQYYNERERLQQLLDMIQATKQQDVQVPTVRELR